MGYLPLITQQLIHGFTYIVALGESTTKYVGNYIADIKACFL